MALFNKESDKNAKPQPAPQAAPVHHAPVAPAPADPRSAAAAPRPAAHSTDARAYLDSGSKISGKLYFDAPARVDGHVEGEISAKESLTIGESAVVTAQIRAASVIVAGKVSGDITATHRIEIRPSAKVLGNLTSPTLVIQEGAFFEGTCAMELEPVREERKVTLLTKEDRVVAAQKA